MCKITDWYFVAKERFGYDLSYPMPYSIIKKKSNFVPVLVGKMNDVSVIFDNIKDYNEIENYIVIDNESETKIFLENMHEDFLELQKNIIKGCNVLYNWTIDANLNISGVLLNKGVFTNFKDVVISQEDRILTVKNSNCKICIVWSSMSIEQREYMSKLNEKELFTFAPKGNFNVNNCSLNLLMLIKNKEERERKNHFLQEIDVPNFFKE